MMYAVIEKDSRVEYRIQESARAKTIRISVAIDGSVVVTKPQRMSVECANDFVQRKIAWIIRKLLHFKKVMIVGSRSYAEYVQYKARALALVQERVNYFNRHYGAPLHRIAIRNQKTRWGSCSKRGNIHFNYRIIHLPPELVDYIVVHELCHLKELNHSQKFWQHVAQTIPDYRAARKRLRQMVL